MDIIILGMAAVFWGILLYLVKYTHRAMWGLFAFILQMTVIREVWLEQEITYGTTTLPLDGTLLAMGLFSLVITLVMTRRLSKKT